MGAPNSTVDQNLLPVQAYFDVYGNFQTFIGQGQPFYATTNPIQSGLTITDSTLDSSPIGSTSPSTGAFTDIATVTGTILTIPTIDTNIANKAYVDSVAQGLSFKAPATVASTANIPTLSGLLTIDGVTLVAGNRVLVKNQATPAQNGIYVAAAGAWARAADANTWDEIVSAYLFIEEGTVWGGSAWVDTNQRGGTLGVTPIVFVQFSNNATYTAGTGLTLTGFQFSITNTGATAATYGSASRGIVQTVNAQGQITNIFDQDISIAVSQLNNLGTGVGTWLTTPTSANLAAAVTDETGAGALVFANSPTLVTPVLGTPASGDFSTGTFTWPTFNQNTSGYAAGLAGGAAGSVPYQTAANTTAMLAKGTDGQILSLTSGLPVWIDNKVGTVTSIATAGTVNGLTLTGGTITTTGTITLGGTLDLSSPPAIGGTTPAAITGTTITAATYFASENYYGLPAVGGNLKTSAGVSLLNWDGAGSGNITVNGGLNANPANKNISIAPTGTGTVTINPATASTMNNVGIGGTTPLAGTFTDLRFNGTLSLAGSTGTANYLLQSNGASAPSWVNPATLTVSAASTATTATNATNIAITDDTTTNASVYPTWVTSSTGNLPAKTASSKLSFNPSTGTLSATVFSGSGAGLTNIAVFPAGTALLFQQTSAPTGWTKVTTNNDAALRVVSGTASTGGSVGFTTAFASQAVSGTVASTGSTTATGTVGATTLSTGQMPSHTHTTTPYAPGGAAAYLASGYNSFFDGGSGVSGAAGGGGSHDHTFTGAGHTHTSGAFTGTAINLAVKYVDVIVATKD
ncbi:hypothetical protein UFOVP42_43 [uncultured Caudovirales phage]|uniref:Tail fiber protein n=1 Tax=uncultured Caudovirales phage TaxID=2100421 RepID=A0A6J5KM73_9CAUD|nr:hypothetical protein UFOVP42_43 [uncultured Caudovirales phage]